MVPVIIFRIIVICIITIFYTSFIILIPIGLISGAQFSFGCKLLSLLEKKSASLIGRVYVFEAVGSIIGGLVAIGATFGAASSASMASCATPPWRSGC